MFEMFVRPLSDAEKEDFYQYHRRACGVWGISENTMPRTWKDFEEYQMRMWASDILFVTKPAKSYSHVSVIVLHGRCHIAHVFLTLQFLFQPPLWERLLGIRLVETYTGALLPSKIRDAFGLRHGPLHTCGSFAFLAALKIAYRLLPGHFRYWTKYMHYRRRMRGETQLPFLARLSAGFAMLFVRAYFGKQE